MTRTRMNVSTLEAAEGPWPATLVAYEEAVHRLRERDTNSERPENPVGWRFQAAIHGIADATNRPDRSNPLWCTCQHGSWFFFPWHRMYLCAFELVVQDVLGDDSWSLPYWNPLDADKPEASVLPAAFRDTSGARNALYVDRRSILANRGLPFGVQDRLAESLLTALQAETFSTDDGRASFGSGERSRPAFDAEETGLLEATPHGGVHVVVGNDYDRLGNQVRSGWLGSPYTAALDPIFWVHHANIDRLWQVWLELDPVHRNPDDDAWLDTEFAFPVPGGGTVSWKVRDVLDTNALGYTYESTQAPSGVTPTRALATAGASGGWRRWEGEDAVPELLGATPDVPLASEQPVTVPLAEPVRPLTAMRGQPTDERVFLRIEGVRGSAGAPVYEVYVNVPSGDASTEHPELLAGTVSTFGIPEASQTDELHDAEGKTFAFDITSVRDTLVEQGRWDPARLQVSFRPLAPAWPDDLAADELDTLESRTSDLHAGRVAVITA